MLRFAETEHPAELSASESEQLSTDLLSADYAFAGEQLVLLDVEHIEWEPDEPAEVAAELRALLRGLQRRGATPALRAQIAKMTDSFELSGHLYFDPDTEKLEPRFTLRPASLRQWFGLVLSALIDHGIDFKDRLRSCQLPSCGAYFIAWDDRAKWCSKSCGSQKRKKAKRDRDAAAKHALIPAQKPRRRTP
jgi:hypothetical protein